MATLLDVVTFDVHGGYSLAVGDALEHIIVTLPAINVNVKSGFIHLDAAITATLTISCTNGVLRCRRGTLVSSPQFSNQWGIANAASDTQLWFGKWTDSQFNTATQQYTLTIQCVGNTGACAVTGFSCMALSYY